VKLAYLGPPGTFGEEAAARYAPAAERIWYPSHTAVARAVDAGEVDEGVVGIENSLTGSVAETLDILVHDTKMQIQHELLLPVEHNLVVAPGTAMSSVRVVYSHPAAPGQCRNFLERNLPNVQIEAALSTSEAVALALARPGDAAAISNRRAAELHHAGILAAGIQDTANNVTRFVVLGRGHQPPSGRDRTSIAFTFAADRPGALASVIDEIASRGVNLSKIESRPTRAVFGEYVFLVDFEGHRDDPPIAAMLAAIRALCRELRIFGSYPRWRPAGSPAPVAERP
jgi:prephenate dehydratase